MQNRKTVHSICNCLFCKNYFVCRQESFIVIIAGKLKLGKTCLEIPKAKSIGIFSFVYHDRCQLFL